MSLKYRISTIGWYNFELLAQTLLKAVIGPGVSAFGGSKDGGRDAVFVGLANFPSADTAWHGQWVFQVKYIDVEEQGISAARTSLKGTFAAELKKTLQKRSPINNFVLVTDVPLSASNRDDLRKLVSAAGYSGNFLSVDGKDVCQLLDLYPEVRRSYPQLLGLADLDLIINRDLYVRSRAFVQQWQPKLATYVQTEAHRKAANLIKKTNFIVLDGPPEVGKTTIAAALALLHVADGFELVDIRKSNDIFAAYKDHRQIFIADDAVGSLALDPVRADDWSRDLPGIMHKLDKDHLLIWTARRYILEEALAESRLKEAASDFPGVHEIVVEVGALTQLEKGEILYNHAKQRRLRPEYRALIKDRALAIVAHQDFRPERIRQLTENLLGSNTLGAGPVLGWPDILEFLNNPSERWIQAHQKLSVSEQTLLSAMLEFDDQAPIEDLKRSYDNRILNHGGHFLTFEQSVSRLKHSFLRVGTQFTGREFVTMQHPSLRDMLLLQLRRDALARSRYIQLATPFGLASIIGGIGSTLEKDAEPAHAVVPTNPQEFDFFMQRLQSLSKEVLELRDWELLLGMAERLLPARPRQSQPSDPWMRQMRSLGFETPIERLEASEIDLKVFVTTLSGRIIDSLLRGFASVGTFENNRRFGAEEWLRLLTRFYNLAAYMIPPIYPAFTGSLCESVPASDLESVRLFVLIRQFEPLVAKQRIGSAMVEAMKSLLENAAAELLKRVDFSEDDDPDEYDYWYNTGDELLGTVDEFKDCYAPAEICGIDALRDARISAERPREREYEDYDPDYMPATEYWTVSRMFEDL